MSEAIKIDEVKRLCPAINVKELLKDEQKFSHICKFNSITNREEVSSIRDEVKGHKLFNYGENNQKHLWAFYGHIEDNNWICIEVGSSDNILEEICGIIRLMYEPSCNADKKSVLHKDVVIYKSKTYTDKTSYKYRYMNELFDKFWLIEINVDNYQDGNDKEYSKTDFVEVTYAVNNNALIWNPSPAVTDRKNRKNQEKQILKEKYGIDS